MESVIGIELYLAQPLSSPVCHSEDASVSDTWGTALMGKLRLTRVSANSANHRSWGVSCDFSKSDYGWQVLSGGIEKSDCACIHALLPWEEHGAGSQGPVTQPQPHRWPPLGPQASLCPLPHLGPSLLCFLLCCGKKIIKHIMKSKSSYQRNSAPWAPPQRLPAWPVCYVVG